MGLFRRKKKEKPTMPKGYKYTKPKKPKKVKASSNKQYVGTSNLYTVVRIIEEWIHTRHFIILEKELEIVRTGDYTHRFSFKGLSGNDVALWKNAIGNRARGDMDPWNPWPPRTEYFLVSHHELMVALHNFLASNDTLYSSTFSECKSSGKFSKTELMEIYPQWVEEMRESQRKQEIAKQEMIEEQNLKEIAREEEMDRRLEYEVKKKITMHNLDKKLNPPPKDEETNPEMPKITYDVNNRLTNIGIISDEKFQETGHSFMFDLDRQGPTHTLVIGGSGSGKTVTAMDIVEGALEHDIPVLVLDPKNVSGQDSSKNVMILL
ncbi:MAG: DUF87 domain-containing protein [Nitrosopumilaceae archaeon]|nr:DUF87 domain-containing protein [Nitrosopumilaceae archaeon]